MKQKKNVFNDNNKGVVNLFKKKKKNKTQQQKIYKNNKNPLA